MNEERIPQAPNIEILLGFFIAACSVAMLATRYYMLALVPALALLTMIVVASRPSAIYYLIILLIPFGAFRQLPAPFEAIQIHWVLGVFLVVCLFIQGILRRDDLIRRLNFNLWPWLIAYFLISIIATLASPYRETAVSDLGRQVMGFVLIGLTLACVNEYGFRKTLPLVIIWSVSIGSLLAVLGYFFNVELFVTAAAGTEGRRALGGTTWANTLARTIFVAMPFIIHYTIHARNRLQRFAGIMLILLNLIAMGTTLSRTGFLILVFIAGCVAFEYYRVIQVRRSIPILVAVAAVLIASTFALSGIYMERFARLTSPSDDESISRRMSYLVVAKGAFRDRPLLGWGPGAFRDIYGQSTASLAFAKDENDFRRLAHNSYVEVAIGTGVIGLIPFLCLLFFALRNYNRACRIMANNSDWEGSKLVAMYRIVFVCTIITFLVGSTLDNKYYLILLPLSQIALRVSTRKSDGGDALSPRSA